MIQCLKCGKEAPAMAKSPYPGKIGQEVLEHVCEECWALWQKFSVNVINDYKLKPFLPKDRGILEQNLKRYLNLEVQGIQIGAPITLSGQGKEVTFPSQVEEPKPAPTGFSKDSKQFTLTKEMIIDRLEQVFDPEIPVNVYDLGLIYDIGIDGQKVDIKMTLTTKHCPAAQSLPEAVRQVVARTPGVKEAKVEVVWEPAWTKDMISEDGKSVLGM